MKLYPRIGLYLLCSLQLIPTQAQEVSCDSLLNLFVKGEDMITDIPCDSFIVINPGYYDQIAQKYNLSAELVSSLNDQVNLLNTQLSTSKEISQNMEDMISVQEEAIKAYSGQFDSLMIKAQQLDTLVDVANQNTKTVLKEYKKNRWKIIGSGVLGVLGGIGVGAAIW
ncbi:MAG: hypothetical protein AAF587_27045 [Bacteroidota bacterium]